MAWALVRQGTANTLSSTAGLAPVMNGAVSVGDLIMVGFTWGTSGGSPASLTSISDNLSNTYNRITSARRVTSDDQGIDIYYCIVTTGGTPTITVSFSSINAFNLSVVCDHFTGSYASSANDTTGASAAQSAPGTGANAVSSGNITTATNGDLIYAVCVETSTGNDPGSLGTGYSLGQTSGGVVIESAYKTQSSAGSVAGTWTTAAGSANFVTAVAAITPAVAGTGTNLRNIERAMEGGMVNMTGGIRG